MNKYKVLFGVLLSVCCFMNAHAQVLPPNQPNQDPCNPLVLCGGGGTTNGSYQGNPSPNVNSLLSGPGSGCMPGFYSVLFWEVTITQSGFFAFTLTPTNACDDYDWTVYKIDPTVPCPQNLTTAIMERSDANDIFNSPGGQTGLAVGSPNCCCLGAGANPPFETAINATAGDVYLVAICNAGTYGCPPGTQPSPVTISFTGSTAVFLDSVAPKLKNISPTCTMADRVIVNMNKPVQCTSIDADGSDFSVNNGGTVASATGVGCPNPSGLTNQIIVSFSPPLPPGNYVLSAKVGNDGNTLTDACDTPLKVPDTLQFTVAASPVLTYVTVDEPACSEIRFPLTIPVACDSIAANGSDFTVSGPQPVSVIAAYGAGCDSNFFTDTVVLILQKPIQTDGTYTIRAQKGTDNNTVADTCGHRMAVGATISYNINSYDGKIKAGPDSVICEPGYVNLYSINGATPPDSAVSCGTLTSATCLGQSIHWPAVGADSVSSKHSPFYSFGKSRMQYIYTADELIQTGMKPGTIRTVSWRVLAQNTSFGFSNFTIKMGCTSANSMTTAFLSNVQTVYSSATNYTPTLGWNTFTLTSPFNWDGKSNIIVEVCDNNSSSSMSADDIDNTVTSFPSIYHIYSFSAASGCNMYAGAGVSDVGSHYLRPKTRFGVCNTPQGTPANFKYTWYPSLYLSNPFVADPRAYVLNTSTYNVMTVDNYGCAHRDSNHIIVSVRYPTLAPKDTAFCFGQTLPLRANGGVKYSWSTTDTGVNFNNCNNCSNPIVMPTTSGRYFVVISDQYNCADTLSDTVTVYQAPKVVAGPSDTTIFYGGSLQLRASGASYYFWAPSFNLSNPSMSAPIAGPILEPITYVVYGIDNNNCSSTDSVVVNLNYRTPIFVPSAFTPNRDGKNDIFRVGGITFQKVIEFRVFNRWGQQIFAEADNSGWDGTYNGVMQDVGIYYYLIRVVSPDGYEQTFQGEVTLLR